jgi:hypothetical protein
MKPGAARWGILKFNPENSPCNNARNPNLYAQENLYFADNIKWCALATLVSIKTGLNVPILN